MRFLLASGIVALPTLEDLEAAPVAWERLVVECWRFLRAGGALSPADWATLTEPEKAAMSEAARRHLAEKAAIAGRAAQSLDDAAAVAAVADGGQAEKEIALKRATAEAVAAAMSEPAVPAGGRS